MSKGRPKRAPSARPSTRRTWMLQFPPVQTRLPRAASRHRSVRGQTQRLTREGTGPETTLDAQALLVRKHTLSPSHSPQLPSRIRLRRREIAPRAGHSTTPPTEAGARAVRNPGWLLSLNFRLPTQSPLLRSLKRARASLSERPVEFWGL